MRRETDEKPRVLIVDDEPSARDTVKALLSREGYDLAFAASGHEALACLDQLAPDVILLDVMMPDMDGFEICQRLRTDERGRHIPIIMVTALDSQEDLVRALDIGADDFLRKPVNGVELRARVRSMLRIKRQYDELQAALRLREELSYMIVHDMGTPLAAILLYVELLKRRCTTPSELEDLEQIRIEARSLTSFINEMLLLAKMKAGKLILNRSTVDPSQLVQEVAKGHSAIAQSKGIHLAIDLPEEPQRLSLDANLFHRVLDNLISNALKFSPAQSTITLHVEFSRANDGPHLPEPHVRIKVIDEGPGIPAEHRDLIFEPFGIVALQQEDISQVGLGLAFCKMVVEAHGGRIFVEANEPRGCVFVVEI